MPAPVDSENPLVRHEVASFRYSNRYIHQCSEAAAFVVEGIPVRNCVGSNSGVGCMRKRLMKAQYPGQTRQGKEWYGL